MTTANPGNEAERLRLETWPIERLIPSPRNARTHSDGQVAEIAGSIRAFGFRTPFWLVPVAMLSPAMAGLQPRANLDSLKSRSSSCAA